MSFQFWKAYSSHKVQEANVNLLSLIAQIDPKGFDLANIDVNMEKLVGLGKNIQEWKSKHDDADRAYKDADKMNTLRLASIDILTVDLADPSKASQHAEIQAGLDAQIKLVSDAQDELDNLREAEKTTLEMFQALDSTYNEKIAAFKSRKSELDAANRQLELARTRNDMAKERSEAMTVLAGIKQVGPNPVDAAIAATKKKAESINNETASLNRMTSALKPTKPEESNSAVNDAMAKAAGSPASSMSNEERIAALKNRSAQRAA